MSIWTNDRTTDIFRAEDTKKHFKCKDCLNFRYKRLLFGMDAGPCVSSCENADMFEYPNWESMKNNVVCKNYKKKQEIHASEGGSEMITHYYKFTITIADEKQPGMAVRVEQALRKLGLTDEVRIECYTEKEELK